MKHTIPAGPPVRAVRALNCPDCAARSGRPCQPKPRADHLARWLAGYRAGLVSKSALGAAIAATVFVTGRPQVPEDVTR